MVNAYKASDGKLFPTLIEAAEYEVGLQRRRQLTMFVEEHLYRGMREGDMVEAILKHREKLVTIA